MAVFAGLTTVPAAQAQQLGQAPDDGISLIRVVLVLILCLALAIGGAVAIKLRSGNVPPLFRKGGDDRRLVLKDNLRISHQIDLCIVSCDGQDLLLAASSGGVQLLRSLDVPCGESDIVDSGVPS